MGTVIIAGSEAFESQVSQNTTGLTKRDLQLGSLLRELYLNTLGESSVPGTREQSSCKGSSWRLKG